MVNVFQKNTGVTTSETAQMELTRKTADTQHVRSLLVPMEPAITLVRDAIRKLTAETSLMNTTALKNVPATSSSVAAGSASLMTTSATTSQIVKTAAMSILAPTRPAEATSSRAPMAAALIRTGSVMGTMIAQIMEMKMDVRAVLIIFINVTQVNGLVQSLENASQLQKSVMGFQIAHQGKTKAMPLRTGVVM